MQFTEEAKRFVHIVFLDDSKDTQNFHIGSMEVNFVSSDIDFIDERPLLTVYNIPPQRKVGFFHTDFKNLYVWFHLTFRLWAPTLLTTAVE